MTSLNCALLRKNCFVTARIRRMEKVMFSVCPHLGGVSGQRSIQLGGCQVKGQSSRGGSGQRSIQLGGQVKGQSSQGVRSKVNPARGDQVQPAGGGGQVQPVGGGQHLALSCGRYASCVHAGGLSCCNCNCFDCFT